MKQAIMTIVVMLLFSQFSWGITLDDLAGQMAKQPLVRADFKQVRQIKGLTKPLNSSGSMVFTREYGVYWHQQLPFDLELVLTHDKMIQTVNGQNAQVITAENNPQMFQFNRLLTAIFNADKAVLEKNFTMDLKELDNHGWVLTLYPTVSPLDKIFNTITLTGAEFVEKVELDDKQGDKTLITFLNHTTKPALNSKELSYFVP